jgi:transposase
MATHGRKSHRPRREFTPEFKAEIVALVELGDRSLPQIARDFDLSETSIRVWVSEAKRLRGEVPGPPEVVSSPDGPLSLEERAELKRLRAQNLRQQEDLETLKRATAFFAKETR